VYVREIVRVVRKMCGANWSTVWC